MLIIKTKKQYTKELAIQHYKGCYTMLLGIRSDLQSLIADKSKPKNKAGYRFMLKYVEDCIKQVKGESKEGDNEQ